jgi:uncharacterized metal-binding protein YceD (DUF177 family)
MSERARRDTKPGQQKSRPARSAALPEAAKPWSVPVQLSEIPASGRRVELKADAATREAIATAVGVVALPRLEALFDLAPLANDAVRVSGSVSARVEQNCVVTLDPVSNHVEEKIDLVFVPPGALASPQAIAALGATDEDNPPEILQNGMVDLGAMAIEFLMLGIDPYPRKPGASFEAPRDDGDPAAHPFAALAALKKDFGAKQR